MRCVVVSRQRATSECSASGAIGRAGEEMRDAVDVVRECGVMASRAGVMLCVWRERRELLTGWAIRTTTSVLGCRRSGRGCAFWGLAGCWLLAAGLAAS